MYVGWWVGNENAPFVFELLYFKHSARTYARAAK